MYVHLEEQGIIVRAQHHQAAQNQSFPSHPRALICLRDHQARAGSQLVAPAGNTGEKATRVKLNRGHILVVVVSARAPSVPVGSLPAAPR